MTTATPEPTPTPETSPAAFDPASHTVDEVTDYLASADPAEVDRVIAAERTGKDRKGIVEYRDQPRRGDDGFTRVVISSPETRAQERAAAASA